MKIIRKDGRKSEPHIWQSICQSGCCSLIHSSAFVGRWSPLRAARSEFTTEARRKAEKCGRCGNALLTMIVVREHHISAEGNQSQTDRTILRKLGTPRNSALSAVNHFGTNPGRDRPQSTRSLAEGKQEFRSHISRLTRLTNSRRYSHESVDPAELQTAECDKNSMSSAI